MNLYLNLETFPEVPATLRALKDRGFVTAILSNGTPEMLAAAVRAAGITPLLDAVLSVEDACCGVAERSSALEDAEPHWTHFPGGSDTRRLT